MLPKLLSIGNIVLYSYPLLMGVAWGVGYMVSQSLLSKNNGLKYFSELFWGTFIVSWVGAKAFFLLFSTSDYSVGIESTFWFGGGFVFYGGLLFGLAFLFVHSLILRRFEFNKVPFLIPGLAFGHAIGRVGCFLAGCCYGTKTSCIVAVNIHGHMRHPVQLYEALLVSILGLVILWEVKKKIKPNCLILTYLAGYSIVRFFLEFVRGDKVRGILVFGLSTSQVIALILFLTSFAIVMGKILRGRRENLYKNR